MKHFVSGDVVRVRCYGGEKRENVVWATGEQLVYLCSRAQYQALRSGIDAPEPIGFPVRDVEDVVRHEPQAA